MEIQTTALMIIILYILTENQKRLLSAISENVMLMIFIGMISEQISYKKRSPIKSIPDLFPIVNHKYGKRKVYRDYVIRPGGFIRFYEELTFNPRMTIAEKMCFEINRLASFSFAYPYFPVSTVKLAKEGFYYVVERQTCKCAFCGVEYPYWLRTDDPTDIHRRESPNCPFIIDRSFTRNISMLNGDRGLSQTLLSARDPWSPAIAHHGYASSHQQSSSGISASPAIAQHGYTSSHQQSSSVLSLSALYPQYFTTDSRTETLRNWPYERPTSIFAEAGFFYTGLSDILKCAFCGVELRKWSNSEDPWMEHAHFSPTCSHVIATKGSSFVQLVQKINLRTSLEEPPVRNNINENQTIPTICPGKHNEYSSKEKRISTFKNWPGKQNRYEMAKAGFFYSGESDKVTCYCCGVRLHNWEEDDEPLKEHARWSASCRFLKQIKGEQYIHSVQRSFQQNNIYSGEQQLGKNCINNPAVEAVLEMGYTTNMVTTALERLGNIDIKDITARLILNKILDHAEAQREDLQTSGSNDSTPNEGSSAKERCIAFKCKICLDEKVSMVFLPCGHLISCSNCAPALRKCCVCRCVIERTIQWTGAEV